METGVWVPASSNALLQRLQTVALMTKKEMLATLMKFKYN